VLVVVGLGMSCIYFMQTGDCERSGLVWGECWGISQEMNVLLPIFKTS